MYTYKDTLLESAGKLRDININQFNDKELADFYQTWVDQIQAEKITDPKLAQFIRNQIDYWGQKDRGYANYLDNLLRATN